MQSLTGVRQSYDWGSTTSMFKFLGKEPDGGPFAELWLGAHPLAPAAINTAAGPRGLDELIAENQAEHLGERVSNEFGSLPYLVKLLAPARPLSIQVHPDQTLAAAGFRHENDQGIPVLDRHRNFKDEHHKPEMVYAITPFEGLAGFRPVQEVALVLGAIGEPLRAAYSVVASSGPEGSLKEPLEHLLNLNAEQINQVTQRCKELAIHHPHPVINAASRTVAELSVAYPGDVGSVLSLLLNRILLEPGQLLFIADGVPHAYLGGFALEVMANSDNVLRLGLTNKHIDIPSTLEALDFNSSGCEIETRPSESITHIFRPPADEFALSISRPHRSIEDEVELPGDGPRILVCLEGAISVSTQQDACSMKLLQGDVSFLSANEGKASISGEGLIAEVFVP